METISIEELCETVTTKKIPINRYPPVLYQAILHEVVESGTRESISIIPKGWHETSPDRIMNMGTEQYGFWNDFTKNVFYTKEMRLEILLGRYPQLSTIEKKLVVCIKELNELKKLIIWIN